METKSLANPSMVNGTIQVGAPVDIGNCEIIHRLHALSLGCKVLFPSASVMCEENSLPS